MSCLLAEIQRIGTGLTAEFALVCGTALGEKFLFDQDGRMLLDAEENKLTVK